MITRGEKMLQDMRAAIIAEAKQWLGTPYHHAALIKGVGVDCGMLLIGVYGKLGLLPEFDPRPYPHDWHLHRDTERFLNLALQYGKEVEKPQLGDMALFKFGRTFSHGSIIVGENEIIHAYIGQGCVLSRMDEGHLANRQVRYFSFLND